MVPWVENSARKGQETRRQQTFAQGDKTERVMRIYREVIKYQRGSGMLEYIWWFGLRRLGWVWWKSVDPAGYCRAFSFVLFVVLGLFVDGGLDFI